MNYRHKHIKPKIHQLRRKKRFFKRPIFWIALLAVILAVGLAYFYLFFPKVQVLHVQVSGNQALENKDIEVAAWSAINKKVLGMETASIFSVNKRKLQASVLAAFPSLREVVVQKQFFNGVALKVTERVPIGVFCRNQQECFFIDREGVIFSAQGGSASGGDPLLSGAPRDVLILTGDSQVSLGQGAVEKNIVEGILAIEENLRINFQVNVQEAVIANPLIIKTSERWQLHIDPAANINLQISKLNALLADEISPSSRKQLKYIYLQYKDRAYYK